MKKMKSVQSAKFNFLQNIHRQKFAVYTIILTLFLIFTQSGLAATGTINCNTTYQQLEGFGGAAVYEPDTLTSRSYREEVYDLLFRDLGLDIIRIRNSYGYSDGTTTMNATKTIVAAARLPGRNPNMKLELVPWSPQASLKSNSSINGGTLAKSGGEYVYDAYGTWWADSLDSWAGGTNGLTPDWISIQNEPDIATSYDSCRFDPVESSSVAGYDQAFEAVYNAIYARRGSSMPKMLAPETMGYGNAEGYIDALEALGQIDHIYGFSHHMYSDGDYDNPDGMITGMQAFAADYADYYNKPIHMTEITKNNSSVNFDMAMKLAQHIYNSLYYERTKAFYWWTLFRNSAGGMISIQNSSTYDVRDIYYFFRHYAYFTDPGWSVVNTTNDSSNLRVAAFKNPAGDQLTVVITNISSAAESLNLTLNGFSPDDSEVYRSSASEHWVNLGTFTNPVSLPAQSITTITLYNLGPQNTLTTSSTEGGNVTVPGEGNYNYPQDTNANITAAADQYFHFVEWTGTAVTAGKVENTTATSTKVYMDANYTVIANFEANPPDVTPPTPSQMTWATVPTATGSSTITMTAVTASDSESPPVEYYFECTNHNDANSDWQASPTYTASGLIPDTLYSFRVKARDSYLTPNENLYSGIASATTLMPSTDANIIGAWATGTTHAKVSGTDRALIFIAHGELTSDMNLASVTYGGQAMTKIIDRNYFGASGTAYVAAFILNEAGIAAATTSTFTPTWSGTSPAASGYSSIFLSNVNQTNPVGLTASNGSTSDPISTAALAADDGDIVIDAATCGNNGSYTLLNGFIEGTDQTMGNTATGAAGYKLATGASEIPSADYSATVNRQTIIGFVIKAASGAINYPPEAPQNLTATAGNGTVSLDWDDNSEIDLDGYNVYRSTTSGSGYIKQNVSLLDVSEYIDNSVTNGINYYYVVTAVDEGGSESVYSNEAPANPNYQDCEDVQNAGQGLKSDLTNDCYVNYKDLKIVADNWLDECTEPENCGGADFAPVDGTVDLFDLGDFANQWMQCNDPADLNCSTN